MKREDRENGKRKKKKGEDVLSSEESARKAKRVPVSCAVLSPSLKSPEESESCVAYSGVPACESESEGERR